MLRIDPLVRFNIELKTFPWHPGPAVDGATMADAVVAVADAAGAGDRIIVQSFDWRGPRRLRRTRPDIDLAWLTSCGAPGGRADLVGRSAPGGFRRFRSRAPSQPRVGAPGARSTTT